MIDAGHQVRLVLRAQSGDLEAAEELIRGIQSALLGYICRLAGRSDAEDILQGVLLQIFRKIADLRDPELFRAWAYRISSRAAFAYLKRKRRWSDQCDDQAVMEDLPAPPQEEISRLFQDIPELMDELSPGSRAVLLLHYIHEMTIEEVAAILKISSGTAKSRLSYGLSCLRKNMKKRGQGYVR
jgi:RNA polymerase sigma-70 factor (ECF subfamily)